MAVMTLDTYEPAWNFIGDRRTQFKFQCEYEVLSRIQDIKEIREIFLRKINTTIKPIDNKGGPISE